MENGVWKWKDGHPIFIKDKTEKTTNEYMNEKIRNSVIRINAKDQEKQYKIPKEIIEQTYNKHRNPYNDQFADFYITNISPDDFLQLTTTSDTISSIYDDIKFRQYGSLNLDKINQGYMFLEIDMKTGKVMQHEGRHRMALMKDAGYKDVEIMIFPSSGTTDRYNPQTYTNKTITNQQGNNFSASLKQIVPINKETFEKIKGER